MHVSDRVTDPERCLLPPGAASAAAVAPGQQVRLHCDDGPVAFTVDVTDGRRGYVGPGGRDRLGVETDRFRAEIDPTVVHPTKSPSTAADEGGFVERVVDPGGTEVGVVAPHGGDVEYGTGAQAVRIGERLDVPTWFAAGWWPGGGAYRRWHVTSTAIHPASFPALGTIADRAFDRVVSFHGWSESHVAIGGGAPFEVRTMVRDAVADAVDGTPVRLATDESRNGDDPDNLVNWLTASGRGGIQLEQSLEARTEYGDAVADAVSEVLESSGSDC